MLILGCIKEIHDFDLVVSLPNGHFGVVPITHICDVYTETLHHLAMVNDEDNPEQVWMSSSRIMEIS